MSIFESPSRDVTQSAIIVLCGWVTNKGSLGLSKVRGSISRSIIFGKPTPGQFVDPDVDQTVTFWCVERSRYVPEPLSRRGDREGTGEREWEGGGWL